MIVQRRQNKVEENEMQYYMSKLLHKDRSRIDLMDNGEVRYWCGKFDCNREDLEIAVLRVGASADAVRNYFSN